MTWFAWCLYRTGAGLTYFSPRHTLNWSWYDPNTVPGVSLYQCQSQPLLVWGTVQYIYIRWQYPIQLELGPQYCWSWVGLELLSLLHILKLGLAILGAGLLAGLQYHNPALKLCAVFLSHVQVCSPSIPYVPETNPFEWWNDGRNKERYPLLVKYFNTNSSFQANNCSSERVFHIDGLVMPKRRKNLNIDMHEHQALARIISRKG